MRVPLLVRWPGRVPANAACAELVTLMDLLPTFARLAGEQTAGEVVVDGRDIGALMKGARGATSPHDAFFYYMQDQLQAVRSGRWKLYVRADETRARSGKVESTRERGRLYDVVADPGETTDVASANLQIVRQIETYAERARGELGDLHRAGRGQRPAGWVADPRPQVRRD